MTIYLSELCAWIFHVILCCMYYLFEMCLDDNIKSFIFNTWPQFAIGPFGQCLTDKANYNEDESMTLSNKYQHQIKGYTKL